MKTLSKIEASDVSEHPQEVIQSWSEYCAFLVKTAGDCLSRVKDSANLKELIIAE